MDVIRHDVLIVGGGLGGAAAALALGRKGYPVKILEQAPELGVIGFGIQLGPNVFPMFDRLGVTDAVMASAIRPKAVMMVDSIDAVGTTNGCATVDVNQTSKTILNAQSAIQYRSGPGFGFFSLSQLSISLSMDSP